MLVKISCFLTILPSLFLSGVESQFGIAKDRKGRGGTTFQELNERAKRMDGEAGGGGMDQLMEQFGVDPTAMQKMMGSSDMFKNLEKLGPQLDEAMKMMADMSPDELAKQMQDAIDMFSGDGMMANMMNNQEDILNVLEQTGAVGAEELEKFKKDPEYFEQKVKESMNQMKEVFTDPSMLKAAKEGIEFGQEMREMMSNLSDEDIEDVRQTLIGDGKGADPMMTELFKAIDTEEMEDVLRDPIKFRKSLKEGLALMNPQKNMADGAGVGEL